MDLIGFQRELEVIPESLLLSPVETLEANNVATTLDRITPEQPVSIILNVTHGIQWN